MVSIPQRGFLIDTEAFLRAWIPSSASLATEASQVFAALKAMGYTTEQALYLTADPVYDDSWKAMSGHNW